MRFVVRDFTASHTGTPSRMSLVCEDAPAKVCKFYHDVIASDPFYDPQKEHVIVLTLDSRMQMTGWNLVSIGGLTETSCHPREIFRPVIARAAHAFVLIHNHPSGDSSPSREDARMTRKLKECSDLFGIEMVDHLIIGRIGIGEPAFYSFKQAGML
ncbi:MAG: JAB domain-containing protein [Luteolibacter sp.]